MKTVLVTGANGFVGMHLVKELAENGYRIVGFGGHKGFKKPLPFLDQYIVLDLTKISDVETIDFKNIDYIIHLAGLAAVGPSYANPMDYISTNMGIEVNLYEEAIKQNVRPRFLIISSGTLYNQRSKLPLKEKSDIEPSSPYAISKLGQEELARYYSLRGFESIIARPFNHVGPGQNTGFIVPDLMEQALNVKLGKIKKILVGDLTAKRDYTDVRDIVKAYRLLLTKGIPSNVYNICSGKSVSGKEILKIILKQLKIKPQIEIDPLKIRPVDITDIYGSYKKLNEATGWQPTISLETTIKDVVRDWNKKI